jgi:hypothetical protein
MEFPAAESLALDVCSFDDWPPLLDFGLLMGGKSVRRLLLSRENLLSELCNPCAQVRLGQDRLYRGIELGDYVLRGIHLPLCLDALAYFGLFGDGSRV